MKNVCKSMCVMPIPNVQQTLEEAACSVSWERMCFNSTKNENNTNEFMFLLVMQPVSS